MGKTTPIICLKLAVLWLAGALSPTVLAQAPSLNGDILSIPVLRVGTQYYNVDLQIVPGSDPLEFTLTAGTEISVSNSGNPSTFVNNVLTIPALTVDGVTYFVNLQLLSQDPFLFRLLNAGVVAADPEQQRQEAISIFAASLAGNVVQTRCITCHVEGGAARDSNLIFQLESASSTLNNFSVFESLLNSRPDGREYILARVSGDDHPGGNQLPVGSSDYNLLASMLALLTGTGITSSSNVQFLSGITLKSNADTLRRAAIILSGRLPSAAELALAASGNDADLRSALRGLMAGDGFHQFLLDGANDRLLVRGIRDFSILGGCEICFPVYVNRRNELALANLAAGTEESFELLRYIIGINHGLREAPLELIAYVVENDRPYSEILTADYTMFNPLANFAVQGTATFDDEENLTDFQPGQMTGAYSPSDGAVYEELVEIDSVNVVDPGPLRIDYPHAGVLNTLAFLSRYPSTATNRNRARARWSFLHFLDFDIERSAPRTTDAVALADTNNPTMFNENCTVCHSTMDPVAGAFQNYGDEGFYRQQFGGMDSLDEFYKYPEDDASTPYQFGDTWYRDMRTPGIFSETAPDASNSVQWLASQIVAETGFSVAAVKFWWPALIGSEVIGLPEVESDIDYQSQLAAYDAQNQAIQNLASQFMSGGQNLKSLLVEMVMSPWFRAESVDSAQLSAELLTAHQLVELGSEKLLTPERLQRKTGAITGFNWYSYTESILNRNDTGLGTIYRLYYGGINSSSITKRATTMTPLMSTVAMSHALESACPIVLKEFILDSSDRRLFEGIEDSVTPANGEAAIRLKLVQLHQRMLGKTYANNSQEINDAYQLFVNSWQAQIDSGEPGGLATESERCDFYLDINFFDGTEIENQATMIVSNDEGFFYRGFDWDVINDYIWSLTEDPNHTKQAWVTVITYLMTHYHYLYE